jgi:alkylation response protein AidB-like acyl-CoA dehydrogenase
MDHYQSNVRDIEFNLFEVFGPTVFGSAGFGSADGPFVEFDENTARGVLDEVDRLARERLAPSYTVGDRNPPIFEPATHTAPLSEPLHRSYRSFMDSEFWRLDLPAELGGTPTPRMLWWSVAELVLGANAPLWMYSSGPSLANVLFAEGTPEQREWARLFVERRWAATMVLTEPDAGSDVGAGRTRALPQPDGSWHLEGVKRFITGGEHDLAENIVHYVLARPVGVAGAGGPGTKGLSLFVVPKFHFDPTTGALGERNGVFATNLEHKLGLRASNTCELTFGAHGVPAKGWLLGDVHDGIRQMFEVVRGARMMVGTKAMATLSTGYLTALGYARTRVQGPDLRRATDRTAPRVTIVNHPDVRRSLALQKAYAEGLRALVCYTAGWHDRARLAAHAGDVAAAQRAELVNDLLLPVVKGCASERAYELIGQETLQTLGGSGYLLDYPVEQYLRDSKIDTLYEGTTAIQSLDLVFRKVLRDGGAALGTLAGEIRAFLETEAGNGRLKEERLALGAALADVEGMFAAVTSWITAAAGGAPDELLRIGLASRRILLAVGDLTVGWLLQRQAEVALAALGRDGLPPAENAFYAGKVASAAFFAREVLPRLASDRRIVEGTTLDVMELPEECL